MKRATHFLVPQSWKILMTDIGINPTEVLMLAELPVDLFSRRVPILPLLNILKSGKRSRNWQVWMIFP